MSHAIGLKCLLCGAEYALHEVEYVCPLHGDEGILDVQYDYASISRTLPLEDLVGSRDYSIWRYKPLLPVEPESPVPPLSVGWTPLYPADRLAESLNLKHLWIKDDGRQPTASLKDRASAIAVVRAREAGSQIVATASTGNAAAALAGLCASVGQPNVIFVPASIPEAKIAQLLVFGSTVLLVEGTYDDAFELCLEATRTYGWYNRNTGYNPYMTEGKKTAVLEICEQLYWRAPDCIFVSVGDGCIIGGLHKGLKDLLALGWIDHMPRLIGVQAAGSAALYNAWKRGVDPSEITPVEVHTIADSIAAGLPRDRIKAMRAVRESGGAFVAVTDDEILQAMQTLAGGCGVFAEPAGAASFAGLLKAVPSGLVESGEQIVVLITGSGLKDVRAVLKLPGKGKTVRIEPRLEAVAAALQ
ncbi:MAG: threonine synthase [Deltaproteobacteria bacterium]|nr:threonine synthase [Deltaproteobacteria bacterium]